ncbi:hypothetical protein GQ55_4G034100 [Panicum hallii var. hallii]|uniref:Uncharacterized protein n=1 Tax=Panicum hallii var. hallii TaxID=1504633 RepID=A0A2T7DUV5_9POAL|nr:hypothetical protein GQ55_4G034100 [Panicum hallii var. hallii]
MAKNRKKAKATANSRSGAEDSRSLGALLEEVAACGWLRSKWMEVGAQDNGAAGSGGGGGGGRSGAGRGGWLRLRPAGPFTFGALGDVYVCEKERKESVCGCLGPTAYDSAKMTYASMGCGSMDRDKENMGDNVGQWRWSDEQVRSL